MRAKLSISNPVKFTPKVYGQAAAYNSIPFDMQQYRDRILPWWQKRDYFQKWQTTDAIRLQAISDSAPIRLDVIGKHGRVFSTLVFDRKQQDASNPGTYIFECDLSLASIPEGCYILRVTFGSGGAEWISEPQSIKARHPHTTYIEYKHSRGYNNDLIFRTGFSPAIRVEGWLGRLKKGAKDTIWENQRLNQTVIDSKTYRVWPYHIGFTYGVPDWLYDKLVDIFGMDILSIDGVLYTKAEAGAEFEETVIEGYPLRGYRVDLRENINRSSIIIDSESNMQRKLVVVGNIETNLFGDLSSNASTNQVPALNYE